MDQVYRIGSVRDKVLALLRTQARVMTAQALTEALGMPYWAVKAGVEAAQIGGLAVYVPGAGYEIASKEHVAGVNAALAARELIAN